MLLIFKPTLHFSLVSYFGKSFAIYMLLFLAIAALHLQLELLLQQLSTLIRRFLQLLTHFPHTQ